MSACPTPPLCGNRNTCPGGCKMPAALRWAERDEPSRPSLLARLRVRLAR